MAIKEIKCPICQSVNTYYSALHMGWICDDCLEKKPFSIDVVNLANLKTRKSGGGGKRAPVGLILKVGDIDKDGNTLVFRESISGVIHDIWENKNKTRYIIGIPRSDTTGTVLKRTKSKDDALDFISTIGVIDAKKESI